MRFLKKVSDDYWIGFLDEQGLVSSKMISKLNANISYYRFNKINHRKQSEYIKNKYWL